MILQQQLQLTSLPRRVRRRDDRDKTAARRSVALERLDGEAEDRQRQEHRPDSLGRHRVARGRGTRVESRSIAAVWVELRHVRRVDLGPNGEIG